MVSELSVKVCDRIRACIKMRLFGLATIFVKDIKDSTPTHLQGAKFYLMDDGRWLILDYLNIPDAPRHYIDCIEGDICNMNVRIISDETKKTIENNLEVFE